jgi:hypothetical protein
MNGRFATYLAEHFTQHVEPVIIFSVNQVCDDVKCTSNNIFDKCTHQVAQNISGNEMICFLDRVYPSRLKNIAS